MGFFSSSSFHMTLISGRNFLSGLIPQTLSFASCLYSRGLSAGSREICCRFAMDSQESSWSWVIMVTHLCNAGSDPWMKGPTVQKYKVALCRGGDILYLQLQTVYRECGEGFIIKRCSWFAFVGCKGFILKNNKEIILENSTTVITMLALVKMWKGWFSNHLSVEILLLLFLLNIPDIEYRYWIFCLDCVSVWFLTKCQQQGDEGEVAEEKVSTVGWWRGVKMRVKFANQYCFQNIIFIVCCTCGAWTRFMAQSRLFKLLGRSWNSFLWDIHSVDLSGGDGSGETPGAKIGVCLSFQYIKLKKDGEGLFFKDIQWQGKREWLQTERQEVWVGYQE